MNLLFVGKEKNMILESFDSCRSEDITAYINEYNIKREDIQAIVYNTERQYYTLFYWTD